MKKFLCILLLAGCTTLPFEKTPDVALAPGLSAAQLAAHAWPAADAHYRIRQTVLFELRGAKVPMTGLMDLDMRRGTIRLVALNDLGVKFFDLELDREGEQLHYLLPELARFPDFGQVVASAVRRMFLQPRPTGNEQLEYLEKRYRLFRQENGIKLRFDFGGTGSHLLASEAEGPDQEWRIDYYEHAGKAPAAPGGIILQDFIQGYRLTLWLDEVTRREP